MTKLIKKFQSGGSASNNGTAGGSSQLGGAMLGFMNSSAYGMIAQGVGGIASKFPTPNADLNSNNLMAALAREGISNALLSSGNPYAMAAGAAVKIIDKTGGFTDVSEGLGKGNDIGNAIMSFALPGAGWFMPKTDEYKMSADMKVMSRAYAGSVKDAGTALSNAGAKLWFGRGSANTMINDAKSRDAIVSNIKLDADMDYLTARSMTQNKAMSHQYDLLGGYNQTYARAGKFGLKLERTRQLAIKFKEPSEIKEQKEVYVMKDGGEFFAKIQELFIPTTEEQNKVFFDSLLIDDDIQKFLKGGKTSEEVKDPTQERIKYLIETVIKPAAEAGNPTARRLMDLDLTEYTFTEDDVNFTDEDGTKNGYTGNPGDTGNVYVSSRDEYLTPSILYRDGKLVFLGRNPKWTKEVIEQSIKFPSKEDARFFGDNYHNYPYLTPTLAKHEPKRIKSDKSYYDKDTDSIYYNNDEAFEHEYFHARPDLELLESLKEYYDNLNDEKILQFGGDLNFVKRFENDPSHFYSPEELGARVKAAKYMTKGQKYSPEFFKELRKDENKYGDNMRDLLHMYNDEILSKIFNTGNPKLYKEGGQMNVIPEGSLHARLHHMENADNLTKKGIPVVDNEGNQQAEIEHSEIIFTKEVTDKLEELYKKFKSDEYTNKEKENFAIEAGKLLSKEIIENTDDRVGLLNDNKNETLANN